MDEVNETSSACETIGTFEAIETVKSNSNFSHVLVCSLTPTGWCVVSICPVPGAVMHHVQKPGA